jgi:hypothetical protein
MSDAHLQDHQKSPDSRRRGLMHGLCVMKPDSGLELSGHLLCLLRLAAELLHIRDVISDGDTISALPEPDCPLLAVLTDYHDHLQLSACHKSRVVRRLQATRCCKTFT